MSNIFYYHLFYVPESATGYVPKPTSPPPSLLVVVVPLVFGKTIYTLLTILPYYAIK